MNRFHRLTLGAAIVTALGFSALQAQDNAPVTMRENAPDPNAVQLVEIAGGYRRPLLVTNAGDGSNRLFVVEQDGIISIVQDGERLETPFLDVSRLLHPGVFSGGYTERGLLGLAFHPDYKTNGLFYINYTDVNGDTAVAQYSVSADANIADPDSAVVVLTQEQPYPNHNGGHMAFGPDGYLYIALGDGGSAGDPQNNGQNPATLLGSLLRIDVDEDGTYSIPADNPASADSRFAPEVWAYGLRNPWRFSFDAATGDLYVADVGQNMWEEVNMEPAGSPGGANYGWNIFEGTHPFAGSEATDDMLFPFAEYNHSEGISVTGGYVYRGAELPDLEGVYLYGDFGFGTTWAAYRDLNGEWQTNVFLNTGRTISSFGVDEQNELYLVDYNGAILKFGPA